MNAYQAGKVALFKSLFSTSTMAILAATGAPAAAQDAVASATTDSAVVDPAGEIVVTAQKRAQTVNKVSVAVTALSLDQLQDAGVVTVRDLTSAVPSVQIHTVGPVGYSGVAIRGVSNQDFSQLGSPAVATYVDGVYAAVSQALTGGLYDIERMEILRGPQGTTYGLNATGGNLNILSADPKDRFAASADASYGRFNDVMAHAMINLPVGEQLAIRVAGMVHRSDGFFDTEGTTVRNYGAADEFGGRVSALWAPSESFKWKLVFEGFINKGTPTNMLIEQGADGKPANGRSPFSQPFIGPHPEPGIDLKGFSIRSRMDWKLNDALAVAYIAGYQYQKSNFIFGIPGRTSQTVYDGNWFDRVKAYSNELNLTLETGRLQNILGASQFHKSNPFSKAFHFYTLGVNLLLPGGAEQSSVGIFDQATFRVTDALRVIGGIRWSRESQNTQKAYSTVGCLVSNATFDEIFALTPTTPGCFVTANTPYTKDSWSNVSWKGGVEFDIDPRSLAYLTVTNGFKSGQVQPGLPAALPASVNPEELINYEFGIKTRLADNRVNLRAAIFNMDYRNIQVTKVTTIGGAPFVFSENAGRARIYGAEVELQVQMSDSDSLNGFVSYTHARYRKYLNAFNGQTGGVVPSLKGKALINAPDFSARVQYSHDFDLPGGGKLSPTAAIYYQSKSYLREFNLPIDRVGAYTKTNLNLTFVDPSEHWKVSAYVDNLENKKVRNTGNTAVNSYFSDYHAPRTWGLRAGYEF